MFLLIANLRNTLSPQEDTIVWEWILIVPKWSQEKVQDDYYSDAWFVEVTYGMKKNTEYMTNVLDQTSEAKVSAAVFRTQCSKDISKSYLSFLPFLWFELYISYIICMLDCKL